jgi:hypothetical protein
LEFAEGLLRTDIQIDSCGLEVAEELLERGKEDAFLHGGDGKGVPQDVRGDRNARDVGAVGHVLHQTLHSARGEAKGLAKGEVALDEGTKTVGEGDKERRRQIIEQFPWGPTGEA